MKWAGKPKRVKTTFNGRTERGKYIKPFCPEKEERKRNDPDGRGWSPQLNPCGASVLRYPTIGGVLSARLAGLALSLVPRAAARARLGRPWRAGLLEQLHREPRDKPQP